MALFGSLSARWNIVLIAILSKSGEDKTKSSDSVNDNFPVSIVHSKTFHHLTLRNCCDSNQKSLQIILKFVLLPLVVSITDSMWGCTLSVLSYVSTLDFPKVPRDT